MKKLLLCLTTILFLPLFLSAQAIDVFEEGISNAQDDGEQKDYQEALMDAKRKAIEKAGVAIKSQTEVKDFQVEFDYIESQAEAVLLPGYKVKKIGYDDKGVYHVVLVGKVKKVELKKEKSAGGMAILFTLQTPKDFKKFLAEHAQLVIDGKYRRKFSEANLGMFVYNLVSGLPVGKHTCKVEFDLEDYDGIKLTSAEGKFHLSKNKHCFFRLTISHDKKENLINCRLAKMSDLGGRVKSTHCMEKDELLNVIAGLNADWEEWE